MYHVNKPKCDFLYDFWFYIKEEVTEELILYIKKNYYILRSIIYIRNIIYKKYYI